MNERFDLNDYMIAWTPTSLRGGPSNTQGQMRVGPWPDQTRWSISFKSTSGCCFYKFRDMTPEDQALALLGLAFAIACDDVPVSMILAEFSKIRVWREMPVLLPDGRYDRAFIDANPDWNPHNP